MRAPAPRLTWNKRRISACRFGDEWIQAARTVARLLVILIRFVQSSSLFMGFAKAPLRLSMCPPCRSSGQSRARSTAASIVSARQGHLGL